VKIEACFYPVQTALQPFGVGAVDPGKTIEGRQRWRCGPDRLNSRRSDIRIRLAARPCRIDGPGATQRPNIANRFSP
jgi:hypothetical protein